MLQAGVKSDTAIQNSLMRVAQQQGQSPAQLEAYLEQIYQWGLQPDQQTFNVLLRAYAAEQDLEGASDVLERMAEHGEISALTLYSHFKLFGLEVLGRKHCCPICVHTSTTLL